MSTSATPATPADAAGPAATDDDLAVAREAATAAGDAALPYFGGRGSFAARTEVKSGPADLVSAADLAAEAAAVAVLRRLRPGDGYVGEEGTHGPAGAGRRWVVDGIDGTFNFLHGVPYWCAAVCLLDAAGPVAQIVGALRAADA